MKRVKKISNRKNIISDLDKIVSLIVRNRDGKCVQCNKETNLTCGHVITRKIYSTRWDLGNCFCQCSGCNLKHKFEPQHYFLWFIKTQGLNALIDLYSKSKKYHKFSDKELEELKEVLMNKYSLQII